MQKQIHRFFSMILALCLMTALFPARSEAAGSVVYDASTMARFQRTPQQVADRWYSMLQVGPSYRDGQSGSYYTRPASTSYPYDQGELTQDTLDVMAAMTNYMRWLEGAEPLKSAVTKDNGLQCGALIRNFDFNHTVNDAKKPADMPKSLWDAGKVNHNILAMNSTPRGAILNWCNEGYNLSKQKWTSVGHRYSLLQYDVSELGFGYAGRVTIGYMKRHQNAAQVPFTAFPAPGPMPTELLSAGTAVWSLEPNRSAFSISNESGLTVTVTNTANGASYLCTVANGKLRYNNWTQEICFVQPDCGQSQYPSGSEYRVVVNGLTDKASGKSAELRYQVSFFRLSDYQAENPFVDISENHWFYRHVLWAYHHDPQITSGTDKTHFSPYQPCTREQVMTFLWAAYRKPEPAHTENPFSDLPDDAYYTKPVLWAAEKGITKGVGDGRFGVKEVCTRSQVVTFLWVAAGKPSPENSVCPFEDVQPGDYYYTAVLWAAEKGITKGVTPTTFGPLETCTRAQIVTFLHAALGD